jgi:predicted transcriptional regulator
MPDTSVKQQAHELIDKLPDSATWRDVIYEMVVRHEIELGLADSEAGRTLSAEEVLKEFGLDDA